MKKKIVQGLPTDLHVSLAFAFALMLACSLHGGTATRSFSWYRNAAQTDFQVPITLEEGVDGFTYADTAADGSDLRVADQNGVSLPLEIERWNPNGRSVVWVKVPNFSSSTVLALSWGDDATAEEVDASGLWSDMMAVFHFGSTGGLNSANGDILPGDVQSASDAPVGTGSSFDRTAQYCTKSASASHYGPAALGQFTISFWIKTDRLTKANDKTYLFQCGANGTQQALLLNWEGDALLRFYWYNCATGTWGVPNTAIAMSKDGGWHHIALAYDGTTFTAYQDGHVICTKSFSGFSIKAWESNGYFSIGGTQTGSSAYNGSLDEVRFERVCRSAEWIRAAAETQAQTLVGQSSVTIPFSDYDGSELRDFPAYVYLDGNTGLDIGAFYSDLLNGTASVRDLRTGAALPVEVEHAFDNEIDKSIGLWVKMPRYSAADGVVISRGETSAYYVPSSEGGDANVVDASQVWNSGEYVLVYHMNPTGHLNDVANGVKLTPNYMKSFTRPAAAYPLATDGPTGPYQAYRSTTNAAQKTESAPTIGMPLTNVYTISWWAKEDADEFANPKRETYVWSALGFSALKGTGYSGHGAGGNTMVLFNGDGKKQCRLDIPDTGWHHYAYAADGTNTYCYRDGSLLLTTAQVHDFGFASGISGKHVMLTSSTDSRKDAFRGCADEFRIEAVCRSTDWIRAAYLNQQAWRNGTPWQYAPHFAAGCDGEVAADGTLTAAVSLSCRTQAGVTFCWGRADGGEYIEDWDHAESLGSRADGVVTATTALPVAGARYAFRFFARNEHGKAWSQAGFATVPPTANRGATAKLKVSYSGGETLADFPLCVRIPAANGLPESPASVRFMDECGNVLPFEVEAWNPTGESVVWVRVPELTSSSALTLRFDRSYPADDGDWAKDAVWRPDEFAGVWHMGTPVGAGTVLADSTSVGSDIIENSLGAFATNGVAGEAFHWPRLVERGTMRSAANGSPFNDFMDGFTFSFWAKMPEEGDVSNQVVSKHALADMHGTPAGYYLQYMFRFSKDGNRSFDFYLSATNNTFLPIDNRRIIIENAFSDEYVDNALSKLSTMECPDDDWHHYAFVHDGLFLSAYRDGEPVRSVLWPFVLNTAYQDNKLMRTAFGNNVNQYNLMLGSLDEYRAERVGRSASWIKACYDNQRPGSTFVSVGPTFRKGIVLSIR